MNFFLAAERMGRTLATGVTTVREAGGSDLGVKHAQRCGLAAGPDMQISITILSQTGGHGDSWQPCERTCPGRSGSATRASRTTSSMASAEMRKKVRELVRAGADVIKVCSSGGVLATRRPAPRALPRRRARRTGGRGHCRGKWVMAHAQATDGIKSAIRAGIRSIEHGIYLDDQAIEMMIEHGTYLVPTLIA